MAQREPASQAPVELCVTIYKPLRAVDFNDIDRVMIIKSFSVE